MKGIVYWHPSLYRAAIRRLYGPHYADRYECIARLIPDGAEVVELCMGDAHLYGEFLRDKRVRYTGVDFDPTFVRAARRRGIDARLLDIRTDPIPDADHVVMQGSLYHFIPEQETVLKRMLDAARVQLVIAEPVVNVSAGSGIVARFARVLSSAGRASSTDRFDATSLRAVFQRFGDRLERTFESAGGRELVGVFGPGPRG